MEHAREANKRKERKIKRKKDRDMLSEVEPACPVGAKQGRGEDGRGFFFSSSTLHEEASADISSQAANSH